MARSDSRGAQGVATVIIGDPEDPHVRAITQLLPFEGLLVADVRSLAKSNYRFDLIDGMFIESDDALLHIKPSVGVPGWIRRVAPPDWGRGAALESVEAAELTSWLTLLSAMLRNLGVDWLTPIDVLTAAENKVTQYSLAARLGIKTPRTIVSNDAEALADAFPDGAVVKPLGPGHYFGPDNEPMVVFAQTVSARSLRALAFDSAPFLVQEIVRARRHLRVVTVCDSVWCCYVDASGRPTDWRADESAHSDFAATDVPPILAAQSLAMATAFGARYSSQDWIENSDGYTFVDLNPAGQWLFLPEETRSPVNSAIADWLKGGRPHA